MNGRKRKPAKGHDIDLHLVLDGDVAAALKAEAQAEDRSLAYIIRRGLKSYLENKRVAA